MNSGFATVGTGPAPEVRLESLNGQSSEGEWRFTTVEVSPVSVARWLWGVVSDEPLIQVPRVDQTVQQRLAAEQMRASQETAWAVAVNIADGGDGKVPSQVTVVSVRPGSPADGVVLTGDVVVSVDGQPVHTADQVSPRILAGDETVRLVVRRGGSARTLTVQPDSDRRIGVTLVDATEPNTERPSIPHHGVGGPSGGLIFTLAYLDALTTGDLTGGHVIAGTGTISPDGTIGRVDGTAWKAVGAAKAGADVFFVPEPNLAEATRFNAPVEVVPVDTVFDAVRWLCDHGGQSTVCKKTPAG